MTLEHTRGILTEIGQRSTEKDPRAVLMRASLDPFRDLSRDPGWEETRDVGFDQSQRRLIKQRSTLKSDRYQNSSLNP